MDNELLSIARASIGGEVGLNPAQSRRLTGATAAEIRAGAQAMAREPGLVVDADPPRDPGGRYAKSRDLRQKPSAHGWESAGVPEPASSLASA